MDAVEYEGGGTQGRPGDRIVAEQDQPLQQIQEVPSDVHLTDRSTLLAAFDAMTPPLLEALNHLVALRLGDDVGGDFLLDEDDTEVTL